MKKLISAATSLAMAATMASAAVPFVTGAAATKTLEIRAFNGASTTISADDIAKGAVSVPVGVYLLESAPDSDSIQTGVTINGPSSASDVTFLSATPGESYFIKDATEFTFAGGKTASIVEAPSFAGELFEEDGDVWFTADGTYFPTPAAADGPSNEAYTKAEAASNYQGNAYGSVAWIKPNGGYKWAGDTSDAFPVLLLQVTFPQGAAAGDYTVEFTDFESDSKNDQIMSNMIEQGGKLTTKNGGLALGDALTITIEGDVVDTTTTAQTTTKASNPTTTTVATTKGGDSNTTVGSVDDSDPRSYQFEKQDDTFVVYSGKQDGPYEVEPGQEFTIDITADSNGHEVKMLVLGLFDEDLPDGVTKVGVSKVSQAAGRKAIDTYGAFDYINTMSAGDATTLDDSKYIARYTLKVAEDATPGTYDYSLFRFTFSPNDAEVYEAKIIPAQIKILGDPVTTTEADTTTTKADTTTTKAGTTAATTTVATTTKAPTTTVPGTPFYGDSNCDGKVNVADVVVLNKWLNDAKSYNLTDQGKLNADCCDEKAGADINSNDSDAILKSIVSLVDLPCTSADLKSAVSK